MAKKGRAWKLERASVNLGGGKKRSNRYSKSDSSRKPAPGTRKQYWHPGNGRYQRNPHYRGK